MKLDEEAVMLSSTAMRRLCDRIDLLEQAYLQNYYQMDTSDPKTYKRFEPASQQEIAAGEKYWGQKYPKSFKTFLKLQNGWRRLGLGWSIVGSRRPDNKEMFAEIENALSQLPNVADDRQVQELQEKEKKNKKLILPTNHIVCGVDYNGNLLLFDGNRIAKGEPNVVATQYLTHVAQRWNSFEGFLNYIAGRIERALSTLDVPVNEILGAVGPATNAPEKRKGQSSRTRKTPTQAQTTSSKKKSPAKKKVASKKLARKKNKRSTSRASSAETANKKTTSLRGDSKRKTRRAHK